MLMLLTAVSFTLRSIITAIIYCFQAMSNLLSANIDSGLMHSISLGYHPDLQTRAAFMEVRCFSFFHTRSRSLTIRASTSGVNDVERYLSPLCSVIIVIVFVIIISFYLSSLLQYSCGLFIIIIFVF